MNFEKTPVIDLFSSIQGEGSLTGIRHIFIRTSGCNLRCVFKNSICDTEYSSFRPEKSKFSLEDIVKFVRKDPATHICLTGGEPCLYPDFIKWVRMSFPFHHLTIETNGTIFPGEEVAQLIDLASISPKMHSSNPEHIEGFSRREREIDSSAWNIKNWIDNAKQTQLKYVIAEENNIDEVIDHIHSIEAFFSGSPKRLGGDYVYLMPAGSSFEELCKTRPLVGKLAMEYGLSVTDRIQFNFFGSKREA